MSSKKSKKNSSQAQETKQTLRQRKFALGLSVVAGIIAFACVVVCITASQLFWMLVFWLFTAAIIYFSKKQFEYIRNCQVK